MSMDLKKLCDSLKKSFTVVKKVNFPELEMTLEISPINTTEELKIIEACKPHDGVAFIENLKLNSLTFSIRKINDTEVSDDGVEYTDDKGEVIRMSRYLFMLKQVDSWPMALRDYLYEVFEDMQKELESIIQSKATFNRFTVQEKPAEIKLDKKSPIPEGFKKVEESESEDEVDRLNKRVQKEVDQAQLELDRSDTGKNG